MKSLFLLLIGLVVGALCAIAAANALAKRSAHGRATMIVLAKHLDALRGMGLERDCAGDQATQRAGQIAFAAREIDYAFGRLAQDEPLFSRRSAGFRRIAEKGGTFSSCSDLGRWTEELGGSCQACHRDFR